MLRPSAHEPNVVACTTKLPLLVTRALLLVNDASGSSWPYTTNKKLLSVDGGCESMLADCRPEGPDSPRKSCCSICLSKTIACVNEFKQLRFKVSWPPAPVRAAEVA